MSRRSVGFGAAILSTCGVIIACSSSNDRPGAAANDDGGIKTGNDGGNTPVDAGLPTYCTSKAKDVDETDIDCGGARCAKCELGKACLQDRDCAAGQCKNNLCAICDNNATDGSETDVDCGGASCGACTVGKRCKTATDCKSGVCNVDRCECPPHMAIVALAGGGAYCVDQTEVTKGEYNKFITANVPVTDQIDICKPPANPTFVPQGAWPPATTPAPGIAFSYGLPVHYVDWCDAAAYCKWAKKELCGKIGGGSVAVADVNDPTKSAWFNACSAQGTKTYPYASTFDVARCNSNATLGHTPGDMPAGVYGFPANGDQGVYQINASDAVGAVGTDISTSCQGGSVSLYQMSGNVAEWEDACDATTTVANCRVRGGSYTANDDASQVSCAATRVIARLPASPADLADVGLRCCVY